MSITVYRKSNYTSPDITYIRNDIITEYDMKSAGLNILTELGYIKPEQREKLLSMDKLKRNVIIGKLLKKNKNMVIALEEGFAECRRIFMEKNGLTDYDVLSIKRDAIYVIGSRPISPDITEYVKIIPKATYTTYINLVGYEHYYNHDTDLLDVKKYTNEVIDVQRDYFFKDLKKVLKMDTAGDKQGVFRTLAILKDRLVTYNLPSPYYFDLMRGAYLIKADDFNHYVLPKIEDKDLKTGLISYSNNLKFILELINQVL